MEINKIYYGDSIELSTKLEPKSIDLIITSPPYANATSYGKKIECFKTKNYNDWFLPLIKNLCVSLKDTGSFILNINDKIDNGYRSTYVYELVSRIVNETEFKLYERYLWYKKSGLPTGGEKRLNDKIEYLFHFTKTKEHKAYLDRIRIPYSEVTINRMKTPIGVNDHIDEKGLTNTKLKIVNPNESGKKPDGVFRFNTSGVLKGESAGKHPAAFHPDLPYFFLLWLTDENDVVLDPFMGSGTVAQVSKKLNRNYIGFELNDTYKDIIELKVSNDEIVKLNFSPIEKFFSDTIEIDDFEII